MSYAELQTHTRAERWAKEAKIKKRDRLHTLVVGRWIMNVTELLKTGESNSSLFPNETKIKVNLKDNVIGMNRKAEYALVCGHGQLWMKCLRTGDRVYYAVHGARPWRLIQFGLLNLFTISFEYRAATYLCRMEEQCIPRLLALFERPQRNYFVEKLLESFNGRGTTMETAINQYRC